MRPTYTIAVVRMTPGMLEPYKGDANMMNWQACSKLIEMALKDNMVNGTQRRTLAIAVGDNLIRPQRFYGDEFHQVKDMVADIFSRESEKGLYSLVELVEQICGQIHEDLGKKKNTGIFGKGIYRFEIYTCMDEPTFPQGFTPLGIKLVSQDCQLDFSITILEPSNPEPSECNTTIPYEINLLRSIGKSTTVRYLHESKHGLTCRENIIKQTSTSYKGVWEISPDLRFPVKAGKKVTISTLPSLKKFSKLAQNDDTMFTAKVYQERSYHEQGDIIAKVQPENVIKGYTYGREVVPFPREMLNEIRSKDNRILQVINFCRAREVKRKYLLGTASQFFLDSMDKKTTWGFKAILKAMAEDNKVAICRAVLRDNTAPKLFGLIALHGDSNAIELYGIELPTAEDIREYYFPLLKKTTAEQLSCIEDMVLENEIDDSVFNPLDLDDPIDTRVNKALVNRHIQGKELGVASLIDDETMRMYMPPLPKVPEHLSEILGLKEREIKNNMIKKKVFWGEKLENEVLIQQEKTMEQDTVQTDLSSKKPDNSDDAFKTSPDAISTNRPIYDFERMVNDKKADKVTMAIDQMVLIVRRLTEESVGDDSIIKSLDCIQALRKACIREDEWQAFNDLMHDLKARFDARQSKYVLLWSRCVQAGVTLISSQENRLSDVSYTRCIDFIQDADQENQDGIGRGMDMERKSEGLDDID